MEIKDKVIVITGAAQGLGRTFAIDLANQGARLALVDVNKEKTEETQSLCANADACRCYQVDVSDEDQVVNLFTDVLKDFGTVDALINNAGILRDGLLIKKKGEAVQKMSLDKWQQVINVNLTGVFLAGREMAAHLVALEKPGVIINLSSLSRAGNFGQTNYTAAKAGVAAMTVTWAKELAKYGIRAAAIAPGFIKTDMVASMPGEILDKLAATIPLKRLGDPQEISDTVTFILKNEYVNGRVFEIDGGVRL